MTRLTYPRRRRLLSKGPDDLVRVHTFQHPDAWKAALARGYLTGSQEHPDGDYRPAYAWMMDRMRERIPGWSGDLPVSAWLARSNMRQEPYMAAPEILVVADVPRRRMVLSDLDRWVEALNGHHLTDTEAEIEALDHAGDRDYTRPNVVTDAIRDSWHGIIDLVDSGWSADKVAHWGAPDAVQACVHRIRFDEVAWASVVHGRLGRNARG